MRYHLTPVRMAIIKNSQMFEKVLGKGNLIQYWWECKLVQPVQGTVLRFLLKLKLELQYDPAISFLGIGLEKTIIQKDICTSIFNSQHMFTTSLFISSGMEKDLVHIYSGIFSVIKKKERKKECHLKQYGWIKRLSC